MIDEDLYQQAADELNSDKRRPHIWARACALASDDHDEARYLYTNLRVEELIAERKRQSESPVSAPAVIEHDTTLALEPIKFTDEVSTDEVSDEGAGTQGDLAMQDDIPSSVSAPSGVDLNEGRNDILQLDDDAPSSGADDELAGASSERLNFQERFDQINSNTDDSSLDDLRVDEADSQEDDEYLDATIDLTAELDGTAVFEISQPDEPDLDELDMQAEHDAYSEADDFDTLEKPAGIGGEDETGTAADNEAAAVDEIDSLLDGVYAGGAPVEQPLREDDTLEAAQTADYSDITGNHDEPSDNLDWLDDDLAAASESTDLQHSSTARSLELPASHADAETDRLAKELERQADDLPGQRSDVVASSDSQESDYRESDSDAVTEKAAETEHRDELPIAAMSAGAALDAQAHRPNLPIDKSDSLTGTRYAVYRRGNSAQAVKSGVSWSALFLTLPYLVYRHLFGTAIIYGITWLIIMSGLLVSGLAWLDAGAAATPIVKFSTAGFALLALIGLLYLPFRNGNLWREEKLEQRGYELVAWVRAASPGKALSEARRAAALD
ncbi:MAG: hypothetical protein HKN42_04080 [Granulosicoccus sp.]|nr:hypothetical protein [Granulosicoccus sp.]